MQSKETRWEQRLQITQFDGQDLDGDDAITPHAFTSEYVHVPQEEVEAILDLIDIRKLPPMFSIACLIDAVAEEIIRMYRGSSKFSFDQFAEDEVFSRAGDWTALLFARLLVRKAWGLDEEAEEEDRDLD